MMIWSYLRHRHERKVAIVAAADRLVREHGQFAFSAAMFALHAASGRRQRKHWLKVRALIAKRDGRAIGLDASDRWTMPFNHQKPPGQE
jgi:hypothetical protein